MGTISRLLTRVSEALALERRDLNAAVGTLTVRHGKADPARTVGMDPAAFALVERWLDARRQQGLGRPSPVFCNSPAALGKPATSARCCPGSRAKRASPSASTPTACGTPATPSSSART